eukprot:6212890-Pleurochrysis_carterae.AAC.3
MSSCLDARGGGCLYNSPPSQARGLALPRRTGPPPACSFRAFSRYLTRYCQLCLCVLTRGTAGGGRNTKGRGWID